ncbi:MAG: 6-phosphogluconolactonase [Chloroflexi bacterium]|nr:6-phosphogluconolactonase [Chloroflexota bacterium]
MQSPEIEIFSDRAALTRDAARRFVACARDVIAARILSGGEGYFSVALSGGSTPRDLYALLATPEFSMQVDWARVHIFFGDERAVPPDHADSNFKMANDVLLARVPLPAQNVHRIRTELAPDEAAREYERELRDFFVNSTLRVSGTERSGVESKDVLPRFDLVLLGLGANGHTASLFPRTRVLREQARWVAAEYIDEIKMNRITLTAPVINASANILWLVAGADKAATVRAVLRGAYCPDDLPAQLIAPRDARVVWLMDRDAARELSR